MNVVNQGHWGRTVGVLCLFALLGWVTAQLPGTGVQHQLDVQEGLASERFTASLRKAMERMTPGQIDAFEWAMGKLDEETFVVRYGTSPTVRQVVVGEVVLTVDEKRKYIEVLESKFGKDYVQMTEADINHQKRLRNEMKKALDIKSVM